LCSDRKLQADIPKFVRLIWMAACLNSGFVLASLTTIRLRLRKRYGRGRWRKRKGYAEVRLSVGTIVRAEFHWYEATGIGKREFKIKRFL
jgi:hypothetical protein